MMLPKPIFSVLATLPLATMSLVNAGRNVQGLIPWDPPAEPGFCDTVRNHTASFHINFDKGDDGKKANGNLVSDSIDWANNNANTLGRANFVNTLLSFNTPFPDLKISDIIILAESNVGAVFYYFQAHQTGEFNGLPPTGRPMQVMNTELFMFDADALLARLITVNELSQVVAQLTGKVPTPEFGNFELAPNPQTPDAFRKKIKTTAAQLNANFNKNQTTANAAFAHPEVKVISSTGGEQHGREAFLGLFDLFKTSHPDILAHDVYVVGDGHYVAVGFVWEGTLTGQFRRVDGSVMEPDGKMYRTWAARWFKFNDDGLITNVWQVVDHDNLVTNVQS